MGFIKGLFTLILVLAIMGGAIIGSYMLAQDNPFDGSHKHEMTLVEAKDPTCEEAGVKAHYTCNGCGGIFADETGYVSLEKEDVVIEASGHYFENGECKYCDAKDD